MHGSPIGLALPLLLVFSMAQTSAGEITPSRSRAVETVQQQPNGKDARLTADSRIRDLLNHPAFAGFGRLLLPWDDRAYDQNMRLGDLGIAPAVSQPRRSRDRRGRAQPHDRRCEQRQAGIP